MKKVNWSDVLERAVWTFLETTMAMITGGAILNKDTDVLVSALIGGIAGALSVVKNAIKTSRENGEA
tara:strand:+ start:548 stop:748 length:201 start_codon:yes stop_codon:yes gene_type:complete